MKLETIAVHGGYRPDPTTRAVAVPIYQTVAYAFDDTQHGADLFDLKVQGNIYTRIMNPTQNVLEERVAALEGGMARWRWPRAGHHLCDPDHRRSRRQHRLRRHAVWRHLQPVRPHAAAVRHQHALCRCARSASFAADRRAHQGRVHRIDRQPAGQHHRHRRDCRHRPPHGVPLIVDNTVATPYLLRPIEHGADIVVHSLTKYLGGHGNSIGGAIVDSGKFPWAQHKERFKRLNEPDVSYHGVVYTDALGPAAYIGRARVVPLRNTGAALSPFNAFLILQGIETLALRMERIVENTRKVAQFLGQHAKVKWVNYAGLEDHRPRAGAQIPGRPPSGLLTLASKAASRAARFQDALKLFTRLVNIGDAKSLACHPASTTHRQLNEEELAKAGVTVDTVRLSIGIEHSDDLLADLEQALAAV
jgi:O-acetylhomoserine (thiol)-lyase